MKIRKNDHYAIVLIFLNADVRRRRGSENSDTRGQLDKGGGGKNWQTFANDLYGWPLNSNLMNM